MMDSAWKFTVSFLIVLLSALSLRLLLQLVASLVFFIKHAPRNQKLPTMPSNAELSITSLAGRISELSSNISVCLSESKSEPSFSTSIQCVPPETPEYEILRASLNDATLDLLRLIAVERGFFLHVPLPKVKQSMADAGIHVMELAEKAEMDVDRASRVLRLLATHRIFEEVGSGSGRFRHTAMSALMARDKDFHDMVHMQMDEMFKAASESSALLDHSPYVSDAENSAFSSRHGVTTYKYYEQNPTKGARFARSMNAWSKMNGQIAELHRSFSWGSLQKGKVVDIGGGSGHISIGLAQDASMQMLSQAEKDAVASLEGRVTFQQHSFFDPQPIHDVNAFLLRQCLHNYNDSDCLAIIRAMVPALERCKAGTPFLINDIILPESGSTARYVDHHLRQVDLTMMVALGAKQRTAREFEDLLHEADERFEVIRIVPNTLGVGLLVSHLKLG